MPICSYGGAACCAGPSETVKAHEREVHGRHASGEMRPAGRQNISPKRRLTEIEQVELARIYRKRTLR